jgi:hypothetical protein
LRERRAAYVTTLFDLYGLPADFPGHAETRGEADPIARARGIEEALQAEVIKASGSHPKRFFAHVQPYEFEALFFSDVSRFGEERSEWTAFAEKLIETRNAFTTPEHIDGGDVTHPSARLRRLLTPGYQKVLHGSAIAKRIGVERIRAECCHFDAWLTRMEALQPI